ncbi:hypothetical protein WKH32_04125 [Pantoea agglomerans]|uniref:hypothetical protein n=1 Tax=Enterobacter agglomerans TaxID=549 RepID=UPI003C7D2BCF
MSGMKVATSIVGVGLVSGFTVFSAAASVDTTTSKTATQVTPAQTGVSQDKTASSQTVEIKEATLACNTCSNAGI